MQLLPSFTGRAVGVGLRSLAQRAKCSSASLRHVTAHVDQLRFASSGRCTNSRVFRTCTQPSPHQSNKSTHLSRTMSDEAYSSFLDQANQDTGASKASTESKSAATKAVDTDVPATLQKVDQYYTSESDEPFEPVSLVWSGKNMPSESMELQRAPSLILKDVILC